MFTANYEKINNSFDECLFNKVFFDKDIMKTCAFTGHRPEKLPWKNNESDERFLILKKKLKTAIKQAINNGYLNFLSGMARGIDMLAAELVLDFKKQYKQIKLYCIIFYDNHDRHWSLEDKKRHLNIVNQCDKKIVLAKKFCSTCIENGNRFLVNNSSHLIAVWSGKPSETKNTIKIAKEQNKNIKIISI